ncbi:hypothetical protein [Streptomyces sp. NPDC060184]|uniref:hypothetical protein n=1 Tax=Streptomyces sp. NPDC060184 TaxID=3347064 RepID=UPI00364BEAAD
MGRRQFSISNVSQSAGEGVLDIPSLSILRYKSPEVLLEEFRAIWGVDSRTVALPVAEADGLLYEILGMRGVPLSSYAQPSPALKSFEDVVKAFMSLGKNIILTFVPTMGYIPGEGLLTRDINGTTSPQPCLANPRSTEVLGAILGTGIDIVKDVAARLTGVGLQGVALDITDLWGMGGEDAQVEASCFCAACTQHFADTAPDLLKHFKTFPNPWSLLLRPTATGIDYMSEVPLGITPEEVVGIAHQRKYVEQFPKSERYELIEYANLLLRYMRTRHSLTVGAIGALFDYALDGLEDRLLRILLMEGETYGWTSGLWLEELDNEFRADGSGSYDEIWLNVTPGYLPQNVPYRAYMWRRSRYAISNFFNFAGSLAHAPTRVNTGLSRMSIEECRRMVANNWQRVHASSMNSQAALLGLATEETSQSDVRRGFVGVGLDREFGDRFSDQIAILPSQVDYRARPGNLALDADLTAILQRMREDGAS